VFIEEHFAFGGEPTMTEYRSKMKMVFFILLSFAALC
jgi:hypothetical protein